MILKVGNYTHALGTAGFTIERELLNTPAGTSWAAREIWSIAGRLYNRGGVPKAMDALITALETAYGSILPGNLQLLHDDGSATMHRMLTTEMIEGPRILRPVSYPESKGPQYITIRDFTVQVFGIRQITGGPTIYEWSESLSFEGGGPLRGLHETLTGPPMAQLLKRQTKYTAVQRGRIVGILGVPSMPQPIFPGSMPRPAAAFPHTYEPRQRIGSLGYGYPLTYEYRFESVSPLVGLPNYF